MLPSQIVWHITSVIELIGISCCPFHADAFYHHRMGQFLRSTSSPHCFHSKLVRAFPKLSCARGQDLLVSLKGHGFASFLSVVNSLGFCSDIALIVQRRNA